MTWSGDIFLLTSSEYSIETLYSGFGAYSLPKFQGRILGYPKTLADAKALCGQHQSTEQQRRCRAA